MPNVSVVAGDRALRRWQPFNKDAPAKTDASGKFKITYITEQFNRAEKDGADLRFSLFDEKGNEIEAFTAFTSQPEQKDRQVEKPRNHTLKAPRLVVAVARIG